MNVKKFNSWKLNEHQNIFQSYLRYCWYKLEQIRGWALFQNPPFLWGLTWLDCLIQFFPSAYLGLEYHYLPQISDWPQLIPLNTVYIWEHLFTFQTCLANGSHVFSWRCLLWHFRLWSFQGRDTKLKRFLAKNQLYSNEITKFWKLE